MHLDNFIKKLKNFEGMITIIPLTEAEVGEIERLLNRALPHYYRNFLLNIGLKQDIIWGLNHEIKDFDPLEDFLPGSESKRFFRFGHNGGEDYWLLRSDDPSDRTIYEYDYYCNFEIKSLDKTFDDLLNEAIEHLTQNRDKLTNNREKIWAVQFSIKTDNEDLIIESLNTQFPCKLSRKIKYTKTSPAGVVCSEGEIQLLNKQIRLGKQEYKTWDSPSFYFDWKESVDKLNDASVIKKIQEQLKKSGLNVTMIDYGIMARD